MFISVVYFDQCLGASHTKRWLKSDFHVFYKFLKDFDAKMMKNEHSRGLLLNAG